MTTPPKYAILNPNKSVIWEEKDVNNANLYPMEYRFMEIIWEAAPLSAGRLAMLAEGKLGWKRTTSYTVLSRLIERGCVLKEGKLVTPLLTKEEADASALRTLCERAFGGDYDAMKRAIDRIFLSPSSTESDTH